MLNSQEREKQEQEEEIAAEQALQEGEGEGEEEAEGEDDPIVDVKSTRSARSGYSTGCFSKGGGVPAITGPVLGSLAVDPLAKKKTRPASRKKDAEEDSEVQQLAPDSHIHDLILQDPVLKSLVEALGNVPNCMAGLLPRQCLETGGKVGKQLRGATC